MFTIESCIATVTANERYAAVFYLNGDYEEHLPNESCLIVWLGDFSNIPD